MKIRGQKGFVIEGSALIIIAIMAVFILPPTPISNLLGVGVRPNKTVQTDKVTLINDKDGNPIAYRQVTSNADIQQHVTVWEWLRSLPVMVVVLMLLGTVFPPIALVFGALWRGLKRETKKIVVGVDDALKHVKDEELKQKMLLSMGNRQDESTKKLVDKIQGKA